MGEDSRKILDDHLLLISCNIIINLVWSHWDSYVFRPNSDKGNQSDTALVSILLT